MVVKGAKEGSERVEEGVAEGAKGEVKRGRGEE